MAELVIRVDLGNWGRASSWRRPLAALTAAALLFAVAPELASESVTLTTYYPAPSGVYTQMITTNNTYLARDGGSVGVGTTSPGFKLDDNGSFHAAGVAQFDNAVQGSYGLMPGYASWAAYGTGAGGAAIYNDANSYKTLMLVGNSSAGGSRQVSVWDQLNINGNEVVNGNLTVTGNETVSGYASVGTSVYAWNGMGAFSGFASAGYVGGSMCYVQGSAYPPGANFQVCPNGYYVTLQGGYMSKYIALPYGETPFVKGEYVTQGVDIPRQDTNVVCCPCPPNIPNWPWGYANGCPNF